jgi:hypothetical protein
MNWTLLTDIDDAIAAIDKIRQPADVVSQEEGVIRRGWVPLQLVIRWQCFLFYPTIFFFFFLQYNG